MPVRSCGGGCPFRRLERTRRAAWSVFALLVSLVVFGGSGSFAGDEGTVSATVTTIPLVLSVSAPDEVRVGRHFVVRATIRNRGQGKITEVTASIHVPDGLTLVTPEAEQNIGEIRPRKRKTVRWRLRAKQAGACVILVSASGRYDGKEVEAEATATIEVTVRSSWWKRLLEILKSVSPPQTNLGR